MKIEKHPFPTNMLDTKGKTKVLHQKQLKEEHQWIPNIK